VPVLRFDVNDAAGREAFLRGTLHTALEALGPDEPARWGAMTAQEMVEHLQWTFEASVGVVVLECPTPEADRERMKRFLYSSRPSPREFKNPALAAGLPLLRHAGIAEARAALPAAVDEFLERLRTRTDERPMHPIFGPISLEEWSRTHYKHGVHHLLQFGLLEVEADAPRP
jgi:oxepin-CoA hydrolase / 3-oxo-5,6-dehydrosuberyl-CoA semialdehyde dehydrogenase